MSDTRAIVKITCPVHGDVEFGPDAVFIVKAPPHPGTPAVTGLRALCDGHTFRKALPPDALAAARAAGVREIDVAAWELLVNLASPAPLPASLADRALSRVEDLVKLRHQGTRLYGDTILSQDTLKISDDLTDKLLGFRQRIVDATAARRTGGAA